MEVTGTSSDEARICCFSWGHRLIAIKAPWLSWLKSLSCKQETSLCILAVPSNKLGRTRVIAHSLFCRLEPLLIGGHTPSPHSSRGHFGAQIHLMCKQIAHNQNVHLIIVPFSWCNILKWNTSRTFCPDWSISWKHKQRRIARLIPIKRVTSLGLFFTCSLNRKQGFMDIKAHLIFVTGL